MVENSLEIPLVGHINPLNWDSQFFSMAIAELVLDGDAVVDQSALNQWDILQVKVPSHDYPRIDMLQHNQFMLAESEAELIIDLVKTARQAQIRVARSAHLSALKELAASAFLYSRYRQPWFSVLQSAQFYSQWVENALLGVFDDICLVCTDAQGNLQGFVTARVRNKMANLGLLAVSPQAQGQGIGTQLLHAAADWAKIQGANQLMIHTQLSNLAALRCYSKMGAILQNSLYCFYRTRTPDHGDKHDPF